MYGPGFFQIVSHPKLLEGDYRYTDFVELTAPLLKSALVAMAGGAVGGSDSSLMFVSGFKTLRIRNPVNLNNTQIYWLPTRTNPQR